MTESATELPPVIPTKLYTRSQTASYLGFCRQTLKAWSDNGKGPRWTETPNGERCLGAEILRYGLEGEEKQVA